MKKFLLCMMLAGLMMPAIAQEKVAREQMKNLRTMRVSEMADLGGSGQVMLPTTSRGTLVDADGWKSAGISKSYDRQTQGSIYPMTVMHDDGFIGCTWTNEDNTVPFEGSIYPLRGVAYSYSADGGKTWSWNNENDPDYQLNRVGGLPLYWPSYAQWGKNGEAILARSGDNTYIYEHNGVEMEILNGLVLLTRETKGVGEWDMTVVPYPAGYEPGTDGVMAWARMTTSGPHHQYIHIMSPMRIMPAQEPHPVYYYRTQDGKTWDMEAVSVPEMVNQEWPEGYTYTDAINFAVQGDIVACSFINMGEHGYVLRTYDNGDNWECIKFFDSPIRHDVTYDDYSDSIYIPSQGCVALDNNGKIHVAFSAIRCLIGIDNLIYYNIGGWAQFLSYWNEDMKPIDGNADFNTPAIAQLLMGYPTYNGDYFDWDQVGDDDQLYVISTVPKWPVIGYFTPINDEHWYLFPDEATEQWAGSSYGSAGMFSFPQMTFDADNKLHLVYLGVLDGGFINSTWKRHPFYTTTEDGGATWTQTEYLVNFVQVIDQEFAYLTMAGIHPDNKWFLMAQTDPLPGTLEPYAGQTADHGAQSNNYMFFYIPDIHTIEGIPPIDYTPLSMQLFPNPASGQVKVAFEGKGNITVYNMLGQTVYHVENVENQKDIPLNMASGVYFVTVRSGNATATQKLVVK